MNQFESSKFTMVRVRAASGATPAEVLAEVVSLSRLGVRADVSLTAPCAERLHRALARLGARVRVETLDGWAEQAARDADIYVVGPSRAVSATWRRLASERSGAGDCLAAAEVSLEGYKLVEYCA